MAYLLPDRIDIHIEVPAVKYRELAEQSEGESSAVIAKRVEAERGIQLERFKVYCNAHMTPRHIRKFCELDAAVNRMLELVIDRPRALGPLYYTRILKVARTIADLEGSENICEQLAEAIQYRSLDRKTG